MKRVAYNINTDESNTQFAKLCIRMLKERRRTLIYVSCRAKADELSNILWRTSTFIPHAIHGDEFWQHQMIIIACMNDPHLCSDICCDVVVNFECVCVEQHELTDIIMWNCGDHVHGVNEQYNYINSRWIALK